MPISLHRFCELRPFVYHLTDHINRLSLLETGEIFPAGELLEKAGMREVARVRRKIPLTLETERRPIVLKDQRPLIFANVELQDGWSEADFVEHLNRHVFFWPGDSNGPVKHGQRLFGAYEASQPLVVRIPTADLIKSNQHCEPMFCQFNSGAPRMQGGRRVLRGPNLYLSAEAFPRPASKVVELVFGGRVTLPGSTEIRIGEGLWQRLSKQEIEPRLLDPVVA
jgi:hypothetical protein